MFVKKVLPSLALSGLFLMGTPGRASADWLLTPFIGANFGDRQFHRKHLAVLAVGRHDTDTPNRVGGVRVFIASDITVMLTGVGFGH